MAYSVVAFLRFIVAAICSLFCAWCFGGENFRVVYSEPALAMSPFRDSRKPAVIYYAVDSNEPFMQLTVDFEIRQLKEVCIPGTTTNWLVVLNSAIKYRSGSLLICRDGIMSEEKIPQKLKLYKAISDSTAIKPSMSAGEEQIFDISDQLKSPERRIGLQTLPLSHPRVLYKILKFALTDVFSPTQYSVFLHIKAHGNADYAISGIIESTLFTKIFQQKVIWKEAFLDRGVPFKIFDLGFAGAGPISPYSDEEIEKLGLGRAGFYGYSRPSDQDSPLTPTSYFLGVDGLGNPVYGGADTFGTSSDHVFNILRTLRKAIEKPRENLPTIAFMLMESCDSHLLNRLGNPSQMKLAMEDLSVGGVYAAQGSLWYRNFNWNEVLERRWYDGDSQFLLVELAAKLRKVRNYQLVGKAH